MTILHAYAKSLLESADSSYVVSDQKTNLTILLPKGCALEYKSYLIGESVHIMDINKVLDKHVLTMIIIGK